MDQDSTTSHLKVGREKVYLESFISADGREKGRYGLFSLLHRPAGLSLPGFPANRAARQAEKKSFPGAHLPTIGLGQGRRSSGRRTGRSSAGMPTSARGKYGYPISAPRHLLSGWRPDRAVRVERRGFAAETSLIWFPPPGCSSIRFSKLSPVSPTAARPNRRPVASRGQAPQGSTIERLGVGIISSVWRTAGFFPAILAASLGRWRLRHAGCRRWPLWVVGRRPGSLARQVDTSSRLPSVRVRSSRPRRSRFRPGAYGAQLRLDRGIGELISAC